MHKPILPTVIQQASLPEIWKAIKIRLNAPEFTRTELNELITIILHIDHPFLRRYMRLLHEVIPGDNRLHSISCLELYENLMSNYRIYRNVFDKNIGIEEEVILKLISSVSAGISFPNNFDFDAFEWTFLYNEIDKRFFSRIDFRHDKGYLLDNYNSLLTAYMNYNDGTYNSEMYELRFDPWDRNEKISMLFEFH